MTRRTGKLVLLLHAHLPFVRHPEHPEFLEESWLFEAMTETYIPLLEMMEDLTSQGVDWRLAMSITPPLCEMLSDTFLQERYARRLDKLVELSHKEIERTRNTPYAASAEMYRDRFARARDVFYRYGQNLVGGFRRFREQGNLEVLTCTATHGFLPYIFNEKARRAQIRIAVNNYRKHFGEDPAGMWLAECAYVPEMEAPLAESNIRYFVLDTHGILYGEPFPKYATYRPVILDSGISAFGRDAESSKHVWSSEEGYPGDECYREFYRDLGYDGDYEYVKPYLHSDGVRRNIGFRYHRITGKVDLAQKQPYDPGAAAAKVREHAGNFLFNRKHQIQHYGGMLDVSPVVLAPYDAELFGHWWFEGPDFLRSIFENAVHFEDAFRTSTPSEVLDEPGRIQKVRPCASSWGDKGYYEVWLNGANDWIYRHLNHAEERMAKIAGRAGSEAALETRALNQAARELLLAESSDWAFIMTTGTMVPYAHNRLKTHLGNFHKLLDGYESGSIDEPFLSKLEHTDTIFQELNYKVYS
ncbi:MAG: glycoside hydrolase family 57 protein [Planctomycetota bacterium]|jgi:1,4-alpha-glucan branching enzyme